MQITLKEPWMDRPAGSKVVVNEPRAWALIEAGIAERPVDAPAEQKAKEDELAEALGIPAAGTPARKPGRPRK